MGFQPDMGEPQKPPEQHATVLQQAVPLIAAKIGRPIEREEIRAIGFVLDTSQSGIGAQAFVSDTLGVSQAMDAHAAKWAMRQKVREATDREIQKRIIAAVSNTEEVAKLSTLQEMYASSDVMAQERYNSGEDFSLGAVPEYFLPDWIKNYR